MYDTLTKINNRFTTYNRIREWVNVWYIHLSIYLSICFHPSTLCAFIHQLCVHSSINSVSIHPLTLCAFIHRLCVHSSIDCVHSSIDSVCIHPSTLCAIHPSTLCPFIHWLCVHSIHWLCPFINPFLYSSIQLLFVIQLYIHPSSCPSIQSSIHPSIHPSIHLSTCVQTSFHSSILNHSSMYLSTSTGH